MEEKSKLSFWVEAIRLRTLPLSVAGILVGSALAYRIGEFQLSILIPALVTTLLLQVLSNLSNDYGDAQKGTDGADRIGPKRMVQSGLLSSSEIKRSMSLVAFLALTSGIALLYISFGKENFNFAILFFILGVIAIWSAIKYTVGNNAYGYSGFGDIFVFIFFGIISVAGSFVLYSHSLSISALLQSITIGSFSTGVLHLNNMRDRESDEKSGKNTIAVKLGFLRSKNYFGLLIFIGLGSSIIDASLTTLHFTELVHMLTLIPVLILVRKVFKTKELIDFNKYLKPLALSTFLYSILLFLSFII